MIWGESYGSSALRHGWRAFSAVLASAVAMLLTPAAHAQTAATATRGPPVATPARVTVIAPLSLIKVTDLRFGKIVARPTVGTITVDQITGACSVTGAILELGTCQYAQFTGMGTRNMNARISLSASTNLTGPGQTMVMDQVTLGTNSTISFSGNPNANGRGVGLTTGGGNQRYSIVSNNGIFLLNIGARLTVNANQAPGVYSGTITVSVQYQ